MEYLNEYPSSDESLLNSAHSLVETNEQANGCIVVRTEPEFFSSTLEERLRSDEAFLREASGNVEQSRAEASRLHHSHDEQERIAALETTRRSAEQQTQQRNEKEQKLLAEIEALREAEAEQRQRIEEATPAVRRRSAEENSNEAEMEFAASHGAEEEKTQLTQLESIRGTAESEAAARTTEQDRLHAKIKTLSQVASAQIDRMEESKARLAILEELRIHAETKVCERAEREIRLEAEIDALRQIEVGQAQRIEASEAELRRLTAEQTQAQAEAEVHRKAEAEARQSAAEAVQQFADEARHLAEEEEERLAHLETIRARAEAAAEERAEKERLLTSQLMAFGEAAAEQLRRIEAAETDLSRAEDELLRFEEKARQTAEQVAIRFAETETRRQATAQELAHAEAAELALVKAAEQQLAELKSVRSQAETKSQRRQEEEHRLMAEIEALGQTEAAQLIRIADAEVALITREEELQAAEVGVSQEGIEPQNELIPDSTVEAEAWPKNLFSETPDAETATLWSMFEPCVQGSANVEDEVELPGNDRVESHLDGTVEFPFVETETLTPENSTEDTALATDSVFSEEGTRAASQERSRVASLAERLSSGDTEEHANVIHELDQLDENTAFSLITDLFDDGSELVRNAAVRALYDLSTERADIFTRALREAPPQRRRQIITALDASGLAAEAIDGLAGESREKTHDAFSMLFLMAKAGEVQPLLQTIEKHPNINVRLSVIKLLTFSSRPEIIPAMRSLAVRGALPIEVRSALMKSIYEMSSGIRERSLSAA